MAARPTVVNQPELQATVRAMAEQGLVMREIAEVLGVSPSTAWRALNLERSQANRRAYEQRPHRKVQKRAWEKAQPRLRCARCGGPRGDYREGTNKTGLCKECQLSDARAWGELRDSVLIGMWEQGWSNREIAWCFDSTPNAASVRLNDLRRRGAISGYRYPGATPEGIRRQSERARWTRAVERTKKENRGRST